jgi:hypothetical protein
MTCLDHQDRIARQCVDEQASAPVPDAG